ncbi:hypothetical protein [uncultured Ruminococcus sp.]|uniref:hypothetical protein n=1 Tax=uncultured Ruminococcus sp. TaxID=165186 RepID=UPI002590E3F6|nr:hypothetical protein [uncultured Ruminococcus sp.]
MTEGLPATAANRFHKELRFFFSLLKRKKEAKKEKSSPTIVLYGNVPHEDYTSTNIPRRGEQAAAAAVTLPFSQLKLGRKVSGDPPHAVTLPFLQLKLGRKVSGDPPHAVTLPFLQLKLGRKVSGGLLSLGKSAVAISAGRRADPPLSLLKSKKEKSSRSACTVRFQYHPKIIQEILTNKNPPAGQTGGCCRRNTTLFTVEIGA